MLEAEFDTFADEYLADHADNIRITGEDPAYFARYKLDELRRLWSLRQFPEPGSVLDFGSGIGASLPHLAHSFPAADIIAFDVSQRSLAIAERRHGQIASFVHGRDIEALAQRRFDLIFTSCVFHHIEADRHAALLAGLRARLRPGGKLVVFEHNPINPVTRYIVATCSFDVNAVLIPARHLVALQRRAGFASVECRFTGFFPHALARFRRYEPRLARLPLGAQYYTLAHG